MFHFQMFVRTDSVSRMNVVGFDGMGGERSATGSLCHTGTKRALVLV
jgi:hypothetical protein